MGAEITIIKQGESLPFEFDRSGEDITDWICEIEIKQFTSDASFITKREITPDNTSESWPGFLTSTETSALANGLYRLIGILTNSTTDEEEQVPIRFQVSDSWAT